MAFKNEPRILLVATILIRIHFLAPEVAAGYVKASASSGVSYDVVC